MRLTDHFSLEELIVSETAARLGIDNTPTPEIIENLKRTARYMEDVRVRLGNNVISVSSGYRCWTLNTAIGGSSTSYHPHGLAVDFNCFKFGAPLEVCKTIADTDIPYDQLIHEYGDWVHIGFAKNGETPKRQLLTYRYEDGKKVCRSGLLEVA